VCGVDPRHQEAFVKGLGWPQDLCAGGAAGLGWPGSSGASIAQVLRGEGCVAAAPSGGSAPAVAEGPIAAVAEGAAVAVSDGPVATVADGPARVVVVLRQDSRHIIGASLSASHHHATVNGSRPSPGSAMLGWDGAAPAVTQEGLSWPTLALVSHETEDVAAPVVRPRTPEDEHDRPALDPDVDAEFATAEAAEPGDRVDEAAQPLPNGDDENVASHGDGDGQAADAGSDVSRETETREAGDEHGPEPSATGSGDAPADNRQVASAVPTTVQTAPVNAGRQDQDRSRLMQHGSSVGGVGTQAWDPGASAYGYDDQQRTNLVESLPLVDESTPLAFEVAEDARRRISLVGRTFPHPPHTRILTVANQKGGVGKTTTTVNVAAAMAQSGLNVLVLDIDPQGNASTALGVDHHAEIPSLYDVIVEQRPLAEVLQSCPEIPSLLCAPATIDLAGAEIELVSLVAREVRLQKALRAYLNDRQAQGLAPIDYVFIDCPPSLSLLTVNAFVAADEVFIPIQCEYYALEGLSQLLKHVELIRGHLNPSLHVSSILLTMYDGRTRLSSQVADEVRAHFPETVLKTSVPRSVRISEAPSHAQTVMTYDPASSGALSYLEAARELAEQVLGWASATTEQEARA
jgi:chromosome partitioning protein